MFRYLTMLLILLIFHVMFTPDFWRLCIMTFQQIIFWTIAVWRIFAYIQERECLLESMAKLQGLGEVAEQPPTRAQ